MRLSLSTMKGAFLLVLLLKCFHQSHCCDLLGTTLGCTTIPSDFPSGASTLWFVLQDEGKVGEINSTVFHHDTLASITTVNFKKAGITGIAEGAFASFLSLQSLALDQNKLTDINYKWFGRPATLTELFMSENHIRALSGAMLDGFSNLSKLDLGKNRINSIQPHTFNNLTALTLLDLSDNNLTHLTSDMFRSLHNTNMNLMKNQWQCSCDFYEFIKDLNKRSLLLHADDVICASPPSLRGHPVWNVSTLVCSTPISPGPPPTNAALTTSEGLNASKPTTDITDRTALKPRTTGSTDFRPPPYTTNIVPMLITVIVVLCVVLLLVIILAVLYRRKRNRKTVAPRDQNEHVTVEKNHQKTDVTELRRWDIATPSPISLTGLRAKSANAILFTSPFGVSGDFHVGPALVEDGENKRGVVEETNGITAEVVKNNSVPSSVGNLQNETPPVHCENVPYLSIGSRPSQAKNTTVDIKSPMAKLGRCMHRISTWPPTAVQWQERCKREKEHEGVDDLASAWTPVVFKVPSNLDKKGNMPNNCEQKKIELCQLDKSFKSEEQNNTESWGNDAEKRGYCKEDETQMVKDLEENSSLGVAVSSSTISGENDLILRNYLVNAETPEKDHKLKTLSVTLQMVNGSTNRSRSSGVGSKRRDDVGSKMGKSRRSGSNTPSDGENENVFVDLLHEVVQNRGRWTRDRWRQIHMKRQEQQEQR